MSEEKNDATENQDQGNQDTGNEGAAPENTGGDTPQPEETPAAEEAPASEPEAASTESDSSSAEDVVDEIGNAASEAANEVSAAFSGDSSSSSSESGSSNEGAQQETASAPKEEPAAQAAPSGDDKGSNVAKIAYFTLIGFIIALVMHGDDKNKSELGAFHLRQVLGLFLTGFACNLVAVIPILGWIIYVVGIISVFVFWIMGVISAFQGTMKPVPLLGPLYQKWFATAFKA